jgi:hypothetical protein
MAKHTTLYRDISIKKGPLKTEQRTRLANLERSPEDLASVALFFLTEPQIVPCLADLASSLCSVVKQRIWVLFSRRSISAIPASWLSKQNNRTQDIPICVKAFPAIGTRDLLRGSNVDLLHLASLGWMLP